MVRRQIDYMMSHASEPPVTIWSGHDFTLIGLMVAYRLEQPTSWPEYGSFLKLELLEVSDLESDETDYVVRFSLNGERLRSRWGDGQLLDMIPLHSLNKGSRDEGALYSS
jgi:acid phosphatase